MFTTGGTRLKVKADDIKNKAVTLSSTATSQSTTEITNTKGTDIQGDTAPQGLQTKATQLQTKASSLYNAADGIVQAARDSGSPLTTLQGPAGDLKNAAKKAPPDTDSLYYHAGQLANHTPGSGDLEPKATKVITAFDKVQGHYEALMKKASDEQKKNPLVTAVKTKFEELKSEYDGMLNFTKLKKKAGELKDTAGNQTGTELTGKLQTPATELATRAQNLSDAAGAVTDNTLKAQATALKDAAKGPEPDTSSLNAKASALQSTPNQYDKAKPVIIAFDTVKQQFDELIKLAIEHGKLSLVQNVESAFKELKTHYDTMMPFTKIKYYSDQISIQAGNLRESGGATEADKIVRYFEFMNQAYYKLTDKEEQTKVKNEFEPLKSVYDQILNVTKMKKYADEVYIKAPQIDIGTATPSEVKTLIDTIEKIYDGADQTAQDNVKSHWEALKGVINGEMKHWKFIWIIPPSIVTQWLNFLIYVILLVVYH
ncbi:Tpr-related protein family member, putative [Theileria annulata]|uniref:Tpr-related protein family member, putative n=1 Tax=Theileria annulata TaxID=5874 RepID=Q4UF49_THEAN|nr:Tpr-related protein family member, putative [Theileria annulata]CAI74290.1 Tpr-related protein family member, putative [Theileria annulata]|eukprot:XP_952022.1 Tpr-related protein family member, putative [Theileria annulata]